jgi:hypothetical protein
MNVGLIFYQKNKIVRRREEHAPKVERTNANGTHGDTASTADGIFHRFESCTDYKN